MAVRELTVEQDDAPIPATVLLRRASDHGAGVSIQVEGRSAELPSQVVSVLVAIVELFEEGRHVEVEGIPPVLTTGQAADLLSVSRPTVVALIDDGTLPAERIRSHRRVRTEDVLAYRAERTRIRSAALDELVAISEDLGLYD